MDCSCNTISSSADGTRQSGSKCGSRPGERIYLARARFGECQHPTLALHRLQRVLALAWGSVGFEKSDTKEFDLTLGYGIGGFSVSVTDYWFNNGPAYFHYGAHDTNHTFEAQVGYDFGVLAVNWYTNFAGNVGYNSDGDRAYASYIALSAPFRLGGLDWEATVGATPWENDFYNGGKNGFAVSEVGIKATRN